MLHQVTSDYLRIGESRAWAPGRPFSELWPCLLASMFSYQLLIKNRQFPGRGAWAATFRDLVLPPGIDVVLLTSY